MSAATAAPDDMDELPAGQHESDCTSSDDDDNEDDDCSLVQETLLQLKHKLADNQYDYETHLQLIGFARKNGELDELRAGRQELSRRFPLTPKLWLEWITDEKSLIDQDTDSKEQVIQLFERAVQDYASVDVWLQYAQFVMSDMSTEQNISDLRQVIERGIVAVGLDASRGNLMWQLYRELESALVSMATDEPEKRNCIHKVFHIYRRQLSVPLLNMESTYAEFEEWLKEMDGLIDQKEVAQVKQSYEKALKDLNKLLPFEDSLISSEAPHADEYQKYAAFAESNLTPATVQSIYERALTDNPLDQSLWISYLNYLDRKLKIEVLSFGAYERAVRNCPWSSAIWCKYILSKERYGQQVADVLPVFERSLTSGLPTGHDFKEVWTTYLDFLKRHTNFEVEQEVERLRKTFNSGADHLAGIENADPTFSLLQYLSRVEAIFCKSMANAREIWNHMMQVPELSAQSQLWMEFFHLENKYGDSGEAKKVLMKGFQNSRDWPESLGQLLLRIEREEGTSLDSYEKTLHEYNQTMRKVNKLRANAAVKPKSKSKTTEKTSKSAASDRKRKTDIKDHSDSAFKKPVAVPDVPNKKMKKEEKGESAAETPHYVKQKGDKTDTDNLLTVFVSNLDFAVGDEELGKMFSQFGEISEIRLVRNYKGLSKGFAYVQFKTIEAVRKALVNDRMKLGETGRPVFITEVDKKKEFNFTDKIEKHKLFVSDLHPEVDEAMLRTIFEKYGLVKDIRIVTYRNGHSKGRAYIEMEDELSAESALKADGLMLKEKKMKVAISNPQQAKMQKTQAPLSLGSAASSSRGGPAGYVLVSRAYPCPNNHSHSFRLVSRRQRISAPMIPSSVRRRMPAHNGSNSNGK